MVTYDFGVMGEFEPPLLVTWYNPHLGSESMKLVAFWTCGIDELVALGKYINEDLKNGFIQHSKFLINDTILFIKKNDGSLWICVDFCELNQLIIKNQYLLPLISRLLNQLSHTKIYTKIDLHGWYNWIHKCDEWKTTLWKGYGHFEYIVMLFGLTNALSVFQHFTNNVFCEYKDDFMWFYDDFIFIFSKNMEDHD